MFNPNAGIGQGPSQAGDRDPRATGHGIHGHDQRLTARLMNLWQ